MSTANAATQVLIDQRLDAIDRALLGLLSRNQRLAMVSQIESQIREAVDSEIDLSGLAAPEELPATTISLAARGHRSRRKRSKLAIWSGVVGMVALALLVMAPITYFLLGILADVCGESISMLLLGTHVTLVVLLGATAVGLAIVSLVRLRGRAMLGHGWAITGLCTGPLPVVVGGLMALVLGLELLATEVVSVRVTGGPVPVSVSDDTKDEDAYHGPAPACEAPVYQPSAGPVTSSPAPACAAPVCMPAPATSPRCAAPGCQAVAPKITRRVAPLQSQPPFAAESNADSASQRLPPLPAIPPPPPPLPAIPSTVPLDADLRPNTRPKELEGPAASAELPAATQPEQESP